MGKVTSVKDINVGGGRGLFDRFDSAGAKTGFADLGSLSALTIQNANEYWEHFDSREGTQKKDLKVLIKTGATMSAELDSASDENLALFNMSRVNSVTQSAETASTYEVTSVNQGRRYDVGRLKISNVSIPTFAEGTDFITHAAEGHVEIVESGGIADASSITITYDAAEVTYSQIEMLSEKTIEGAFQWISKQIHGERRKLEAPKVSITPGSNLGLLNIAEGQKIPLNIEILASDTGAFATFTTLPG
ncbi:MAG: hypothetical protein HQL67_10885 [Magnetococcales bacterium]|nr:hypothetical protein [Magnetococcales bacterium]